MFPRRNHGARGASVTRDSAATTAGNARPTQGWLTSGHLDVFPELSRSIGEHIPSTFSSLSIVPLDGLV